MVRDSVRSGYVDWLKQHDWSVFANLTFKYEVTEDVAVRAFAGWVAYLQKIWPRLEWARVIEFAQQQSGCTSMPC